jgi:hypothetical protein
MGIEFWQIMDMRPGLGLCSVVLDTTQQPRADEVIEAHELSGLYRSGMI